MADQSDVETALADLAVGVLYPGGLAAPSLLGMACLVYRGWPDGQALERDLAAGMVHVSVFPASGEQRNTTRWAEEFSPLATVAPSLSIGVAGNVATIGGRADPGQLVGLLVDNMAVVHRTRAGDTPAMVAAVLAADIRTRRVAVLDGAHVTVPGAGRMIGRVVADQAVLGETRRQRAGFRLSCWCADPVTRDAVAGAIDAAMSLRNFIGLADGMQGRLRHVSTSVFDEGRKAGIFRRDLVYDVEYATTALTKLPSMIFGDVTVSPGGGGTQSLLG
jgi:hypothetical protein